MFGLSSLATYAIAAALIFATGGAATGVVVHKVDNARYEALELSYAKAKEAAEAAARAEQARLDGIATEAARAEAANQSRLAAQAKASLEEVRANVKANASNLRLGFIRLLVAGSRGVLANSLPLPAGKSINSRTGYTDADVAAAVLGSFAQCRANGEQLDTLIKFYRDSKR